MRDIPGPLLARGRAADVFAFGDGLILRRYRSGHDAAHEANVMDHARSHGYPAPAVVEVHGSDLVMERLEGPTMLADITRRPYRLLSHADTIASLLERLHALPLATGLRRRHERATAIVHLDLHPDNVVLTRDGPFVIDWTNAGVGDPAVEVADLWAILTCADPPGSGLQRAVAHTGRKLFASRLVAHFDRNAVRHGLREAVNGRLHDPNISPHERAAMQRLLARHGR